MKLLISGSIIENFEKMFKNPLTENQNLTFKMKGNKYQIYTN